MLSLDANFYIYVLLMALYNDRIQVDLTTTLTLTISSQMDEFCNTFFTFLHLHVACLIQSLLKDFGSCKI